MRTRTVLPVLAFVAVFHARLESPRAQRDTNVVLVNPKPFKAICYSGYREGQGPGWAEPNEAQVREDLRILAPYTHEIRTYGSGKGTHGGDFVPKICDELGLKLHLGVWIDDTYDEAANNRAVDDAIALAKAGHQSIKSVIIGNEFMFRVRNIDKRPVAPAEARLIRYLQRARAGVPAHIQVTNADTWSDWTHASDALIESLDYLIWHTHPWWENKPIDAIEGHMDAVHGRIEDRMRARFAAKRRLLGEVGWPSSATNQQAVGSPENVKTFFATIHRWAWGKGFEYWAFASFDESWKGAEGAVGAHWGLWTIDRKPKSVITDVAALWPGYMQWSSGGTVALRPAQAALRAGNGASRHLAGRGLSLASAAGSRDVLGRSPAGALPQGGAARLVFAR